MLEIRCKILTPKHFVENWLITFHNEILCYLKGAIKKQNKVNAVIMGEVRRKSHPCRPCAVCMPLAPTPVIKWPMVHDCLNISLHLRGLGFQHTFWLNGHCSEEKSDRLKSLPCPAHSVEQMSPMHSPPQRKALHFLVLDNHPSSKSFWELSFPCRKL